MINFDFLETKRGRHCRKKSMKSFKLFPDTKSLRKTSGKCEDQQSSVTRCWNKMWSNFYESCTKSGSNSFYVKRSLFQKLPNILAIFEQKILAWAFQKSPNLVTLDQKRRKRGGEERTTKNLKMQLKVLSMVGRIKIEK